MHVVFANTGVQYVCQPLSSGVRFTSASVGHGWQRCRCQEAGDAVRTYHFIQWKVVPGKLVLAVDTTCGDPEKGYFCSEEALADDFPVIVEGLLSLEGAPLAGLPRVDLTIRPATAGAGAAKEVHMVVDFGNSRTGALLIEIDQETADTPVMEPFELINRHHLDAWNENGEFQKKDSARWFSSRTQWCTAPYLPPPRLDKTIAAAEDAGGGRSGFLGMGKKRPQGRTRTVFVTPRLFQDLSAVRMGQEADDVTQVMQTDGTVVTGVSSPKRYLWADDESWLQGAIWHMADPDDRLETHRYAATLQGPLLRYLEEEDPDELDLPPLESDEIGDEELAREIPYKPHHAPRCLMVAALYEMIAQAYTYVNSVAYRSMVGREYQPREIRNLTLTYPSGMITQERERFRLQAQKAIDLFRATLGRMQRNHPTLTLSIDEASAVHLTYLWSELQLVDRDPRLWFSLVGHEPLPEEPDEPEDAVEDEAHPPAAGPGRPGGPGGPGKPPGRMRPPAMVKPRGPMGPGRPGTAARPAPPPVVTADDDNEDREVRIACIDIGGGTSDLMIARYELAAGAVDTISGEMLHRDGISHAGDQLVKRLLERVIVPYFSDRVGMQADERERLFGEERPWNRHFRADRILWINRLFVPLAQAYLQNAVDENPQTIISHTDPIYVDPEIVQSLQDRIDSEFKAGTISVFQDLGLAYDQSVFEAVVHEVFNELLLDFCKRIVDCNVDLVLLAGQPTKLRYIQDLVQMYLPLHSSRIVPMYNHYAGTWYPYQDTHGRNPGIIVDPKSAVVVGAAVESLMTKGKLGHIRFRMKDQHASSAPQTNLNQYYWGIMDERSSRIPDYRVLFSPENTSARSEFEVVAERVLIGRRLSPDPQSEATPVYLIKVDKGDRDGSIELAVTLTRQQPKGKKRRWISPASKAKSPANPRTGAAPTPTSASPGEPSPTNGSTWTPGRSIILKCTSGEIPMTKPQ